MSAGFGAIEAALGRRVISRRALGGGLASVVAATLDDGSLVVIKRGDAEALASEA